VEPENSPDSRRLALSYEGFQQLIRYLQERQRKGRQVEFIDELPWIASIQFLDTTGAKQYIVNGKMTEGFAFVAYPAKCRSSGVMTFIVGSDGVVYQRDLGKATDITASSMKTYSPDSTGKKLKRPRTLRPRAARNLEPKPKTHLAPSSRPIALRVSELKLENSSSTSNPASRICASMVRALERFGSLNILAISRFRCSMILKTSR